MKGALRPIPKRSRARNCLHVARQPDQYPLIHEAVVPEISIRPQNDKGTSGAPLREAWGLCSRGQGVRIVYRLLVHLTRAP